LRPARRSVALAAQLALAASVLWFAGRAVAAQWDAVRSAALNVHPRWGAIALSALVVLGTYALLIAIWRGALALWGARLPFWDAAHVWFVSNLGKYVPGKVWQIGAMGMMAQRRGVAAAVAVGSAIMLTLVNIAVGFAVVFATGAQVIEAIGAPPRTSAIGALATVAVIVALLATPVILPHLASTIRQISGREVALPPLPTRAVWLAIVGNAAAWLLYGLAFELLARGVLGRSTGDWVSYTAVYTGSYLVGYLVLFAPGGLVFREAAMVAGLTRLGLTTAPEAALLAVVSRLWLTVLEIAPGVLFMAFAAARRAPPNSPRNVPP
jgi:glycosyltransferase 2 family protein